VWYMDIMQYFNEDVGYKFGIQCINYLDARF